MDSSDDFSHQPSLLLTPDQIDSVKKRIHDHSWAASHWKSVTQTTHRVLDERVTLPPRGGGWGHWYACPKHAASLRTGEQIGTWEWEHFCPVDGEKIPSSMDQPSTDLDRCVIMRIHMKWAAKVRSLALVYRIDGDIRYKNKAKEILLSYCDSYLDYEIHTINGKPTPYNGIGGGRVGSQTLDEASWIIPLSQGADLIWDTLDEADRERITGKILRPSVADILQTFPFGIHNIQCWKNTAIGLVGFLLQDEEFLAYALDQSEFGYRAQIREGVMSDGLWWEGAWGYHFYTLGALWPFTEAARNNGIDLYGPNLKKMLDGPLVFAMPNMVLPAYNDSNEVNLKGHAGLYEWALARYGEESYGRVIEGSNRENDFALWFGQKEIPSPPPINWQAANYPNTGYAILASGVGEDAVWACLKYGAHGGGHGHPDKLSLILRAGGESVISDPGSALYGTPAHAGWYKTTMAHSTLIVDETSQDPSEGSCISFGSGRRTFAVMADAGPIYEGVRFIRSVIMLTESLLVIVDQIDSDGVRTLDMVMHLTGDWDVRPDGGHWAPPDLDGYRYLDHGRSVETDNDTMFAVSLGQDRRVAATLAGGEMTEVITATGVGSQVDDRVPLIIARRRSASTMFGWCLALDGSPSHITWLPVRDSYGNLLPSGVAAAAEIATLDERRWEIIVNPTGRKVHVTLPDDPEWVTDSVCTVR